MFQEILEEIRELLEKKNRMYGDRNLEVTGLIGIAIRIMDKAARLHTLATLAQDDTEETIEDTLKDIAGYAVNGIRLYREKRLRPKGVFGGDWENGGEDQKEDRGSAEGA